MRAPCGRSYVRAMTEIASIESSTELQASPPSAAWLRILALVYDPFLWLGEIAEQLVLSPHTVHRHVANIRRKLGRTSRSAAVAEAARLGLL